MLVIGTGAAWSAWTTTAVTIGGLKYNFNGNEARVEGGVSADFPDGKLVIPATVTNNGTTYTVTTVNSNSFTSNNWVKEVVLSEGVTTIGGRAFYGCKNLTKASLPSTISTYLSYAEYFAECPALTDVTLAEGITLIGQGMFWNDAKLTNIVLPSTLKEMKSNAFYGCGLTTVTLPQSLTTIEGWPFVNCPLTSVNVAAGNTTFSAQDNMLLSADGKTLYGVLPGITSFTPPATVDTLGLNLFYQNKTLTSVTIPATIKVISDAAFRLCSNLSSVIFEPRTDTLTLSKQSFSSCKSLTSVQLPEQIYEIPAQCFEYCSGLTSFDVPEAVTIIKNGAFYYCSGLTSFVVPDNVVTLDGAFYSCSSLATLTLGKSVAQLGGNLLSKTAVTKIICRGTTPPVPMKDWRGNDVVPFTAAELAAVTVDVPADALTAYQASPLFGSFTNLNGDIALGVQEQSIIDNAPVEYFDLQGRAVATPEHGIFIKKAGNKTAKVVL